MRVTAIILTLAFLGTGCATRLPVERTLPSPTSPRRAWTLTEIPRADEIARAVDRQSGSDGCFRRCSLAAEGGRHVVEGGAKEEKEGGIHELALFVGYTFERAEGGATIGLDYAYWFNEHIGVGPFVDFVAGEIDAFAFGGGVWLRPFRVYPLNEVSFQVAPGVDLAHEREEVEGLEEGQAGEEERKWEARALLRLGVVAGFDLGRNWRLLPSLFFDVIFPDKKAIVLGLSIAKEW